MEGCDPARRGVHISEQVGRSIERRRGSKNETVSLARELVHVLAL